MPAVFGAIAPHGFPIIPELSDDAEGATVTRDAMRAFGSRLRDSGTDVVVIATPHGVRVDGSIAVASVARGAGTLFWKDRQVEQQVPVDDQLTDAIVAVARNRGLPIAEVGFAGNRRFQSVLPLDWGVVTPMWFAGHDANVEGSGHPLADPVNGAPGPTAVIVNPSRSMPREQLVEFGRATAQAANEDGRRIAFIASCDWGHRHREDGPYGFSEASARVDNTVVEAVRSSQLGDLMYISDADAEDAAIDGLWQALMLQGFLGETTLSGEFLSYEAPSYYGMLVAIWD